MFSWSLTASCFVHRTSWQLRKGPTSKSNVTSPSSHWALRLWTSFVSSTRRGPQCETGFPAGCGRRRVLGLNGLEGTHPYKREKKRKIVFLCVFFPILCLCPSHRIPISKALVPIALRELMERYPVLKGCKYQSS